MKEIWKKITRFPHISVSSLGNIRNDNTNRIYKLSLSGYNDVGYLFTTIRPDGRNGNGVKWKQIYSLYKGVDDIKTP